MAGTKISALPAAASVADADIYPIVQGGVNKKATHSVLKNYIEQYIPRLIAEQHELTTNNTIDDILFSAQIGNSLLANVGDMIVFEYRGKTETDTEFPPYISVQLNGNDIMLNPFNQSHTSEWKIKLTIFKRELDVDGDTIYYIVEYSDDISQDLLGNQGTFIFVGEDETAYPIDDSLILSVIGVDNSAVPVAGSITGYGGSLIYYPNNN